MLFLIDHLELLFLLSYCILKTKYLVSCLSYMSLVVLERPLSSFLTDFIQLKITYFLVETLNLLVSVLKLGLQSGPYTIQLLARSFCLFLLLLKRPQLCLIHSYLLSQLFTPIFIGM